jgi:hypothetical protein
MVIKMKKLMLLLFRLIVCCALLAPGLLAVDSAHAQASAVIRLSPATGSFYEGARFTIQVYIENVTDLYGVDVLLEFDPAVLQVVDADLLTAGIQSEPLSGFLVPGFVVRNEADNSAGTVWYVVTQLNPTPPASGSGAVLEITFDALSTGSTAVTFSKASMATRLGQTIPTSTMDSTYQIISQDSIQRIYIPLLLRNQP